VRLVAITGEQDLQAETTRAGFDGYLVKPTNEEDLERVLRRRAS
jgi:hypothetical protein